MKKGSPYVLAFQTCPPPRLAPCPAEVIRLEQHLLLMGYVLQEYSRDPWNPSNIEQCIMLGVAVSIVGAAARLRL